MNALRVARLVARTDLLSIVPSVVAVAEEKRTAGMQHQIDALCRCWSAVDRRQASPPRTPAAFRDGSRNGGNGRSAPRGVERGHGPLAGCCSGSIDPGGRDALHFRLPGSAGIDREKREPRGPTHAVALARDRCGRCTTRFYGRASLRSSPRACDDLASRSRVGIGLGRSSSFRSCLAKRLTGVSNG